MAWVLTLYLKLLCKAEYIFLRLTDQNSSTNGKYYRISGNTEKSITLANPYSEDLSGIFLSNSMVEVFKLGRSVIFSVMIRLN